MYRGELIHFLGYVQDKNLVLETMDKMQIEQYIYDLKDRYSLSRSRQNIIINAIKFYYEKVLGKDRTKYQLTRPRKTYDLPDTLTTAQVTALISQPQNLKHRTILMTLYSAGLRISELVHLKITDIHSEEGYIKVYQGKGKKDRHTVLSHRLLHELRSYYKKYKPAHWLFEGQDGGPYSTSSVRKVFRRAAKAADIPRWATPHTLRHSFATHLLQQGVSFRHIQKLLGHKSSKTTEIYTHLVAMNNKVVKSPLDTILDSTPASAHKGYIYTPSADIR